MMSNGFAVGNTKIGFRITSVKSALADALAYLDKKDQRKIGHNTYLHRTDDGAKVVFHDTAILAITKKAIALNSGGFRTMTTKARLCELLPDGYSLFAEGGLWYLRSPEAQVSFVFADGITVTATGKVTGAGSEAKDTKLRKQIHEYAKAYAAKAVAGKLEKPSGGDCWHCCMRTEDGTSLGDKVGDKDHLLSHMKERYYVPSLLVNAAKARGNNYVPIFVFPVIWGGSKSDRMRSIEQEIRRCVRQYLGSQLGLALR